MLHPTHFSVAWLTSCANAHGLVSRDVNVCGISLVGTDKADGECAFEERYPLHWLLNVFANYHHTGLQSRDDNECGLCVHCAILVRPFVHMALQCVNVCELPSANNIETDGECEATVVARMWFMRRCRIFWAFYAMTT